MWEQNQAADGPTDKKSEIKHKTGARQNHGKSFNVDKIPIHLAIIVNIEGWGSVPTTRQPGSSRSAHPDD